MEIRSSFVSKAWRSDPKAVSKQARTSRISNLSKEKIDELLTELPARVDETT